jgi:hypothetical protein
MTQQSREVALDSFMQWWENKKEVIGAIVCGSYITGNPSKYSDIDLHIILDSSVNWRERGNQVINGILIEYFANPIQQHHHYLQEDLKSRKRLNAHMLCTWKLLFDRTGEVQQLINDSQSYLTPQYTTMNETEIELTKYTIWDMCDNLEEIYDKNWKEFVFVYHNNIYTLINLYTKFLQYDHLPIHKVYLFLTDTNNQKKYNVAPFPDQIFVKLITQIISHTEKDDMIQNYTKLTNHILNKMWWFDINNRSLHTPLSG